MQALPPEVMEALKRARQTAMEQTAVARPMENAKFSEIAQDLDFAITQIEREAKDEVSSEPAYFLKADHETEWHKVSLTEFCQAERNAGFYPKGLSPQDSCYLTTPATGSFSGRGMQGRVERASKRMVRDRNGGWGDLEGFE